MKSLKNGFKKAVLLCIGLMHGNYLFRKFIMFVADNYLYQHVVENDIYYTRDIRCGRYRIISNLMLALEKILANKNTSANVRKKILDVFLGNILMQKRKAGHEDFLKHFNQEPPGFITISPCRKCNLRCGECCSGSNAEASEMLDYATVDRIITEKTGLWNSFFTVISGGEPLMWRSEGKGIIDLCKDHPDNYFLVYTNGTLIDGETAHRMAETGNITPAVSVEGFEKETDANRGKGTYKKILQAMADLREAGVPFGIAATGTRENADLIVSDGFVDFFFEEQGAAYGWIFQYMPIGRSRNVNLMVTPGQRKRMFESEKHIIRDRHIFYPDFWNGGIYSYGCMAGGRPGGYVNIEWNGNVTPCAFYPYSKVNIKNIFANGGNINEALNSDLMTGIRKWQRDYGFEKCGKEVGNFIAPCGLRDHYEFMHSHIENTNSVPIDKDAAEAVKDGNYYSGLVEYDNKFTTLTDDIWKGEYLDTEERPVKIVIEM